MATYHEARRSCPSVTNRSNVSKKILFLDGDALATSKERMSQYAVFILFFLNKNWVYGGLYFWWRFVF